MSKLSDHKGQGATQQGAGPHPGQRERKAPGSEVGFGAPVAAMWPGVGVGGRERQSLEGWAPGQACEAEAAGPMTRVQRHSHVCQASRLPSFWLVDGHTMVQVTGAGRGGKGGCSRLVGGADQISTWRL